MICLQLLLHEKREDWNLRNSMMLCQLCKRHEKTQVEELSVLTELLDLVTELKFAPFIAARDQRK